MAHFVDNKSLHEAFVKYRAREDVQEFLAAKSEHYAKRDRGEEPGRLGIVPPQLPDIIGLAIFKIAHKYAMRSNWRHLHCIDEMISDAIIHCVAYCHNFDPEKSNNPFAYLTQTIYRGFLQRIDKEKDQEDLKTETLRRMAAGQSDAYEGGDRFFVPSQVSGALEVIDEVEEMNRLYKVRGGSKKEVTRKEKQVKKTSELVGF